MHESLPIGGSTAWLVTSQVGAHFQLTSSAGFSWSERAVEVICSAQVGMRGCDNAGSARKRRQWQMLWQKGFKFARSRATRSFLTCKRDALGSTKIGPSDQCTTSHNCLASSTHTSLHAWIHRKCRLHAGPEENAMAKVLAERHSTHAEWNRKIIRDVQAGRTKLESHKAVPINAPPALAFLTSRNPSTETQGVGFGAVGIWCRCACMIYAAVHHH